MWHIHFVTGCPLKPRLDPPDRRVVNAVARVSVTGPLGGRALGPLLLSSVQRAVDLRLAGGGLAPGLRTGEGVRTRSAFCHRREVLLLPPNFAGQRLARNADRNHRC